MAKEVKHYEGKCSRCDLVTKREDCPNCNKKKLAAVEDINAKVIKIQCGVCTHEFTGPIECIHCKSKIYWANVKTIVGKELPVSKPKPSNWFEDLFSMLIIVLIILVALSKCGG